MKISEIYNPRNARIGRSGVSENANVPSISNINVLTDS
jgi:hypothetical protein